MSKSENQLTLYRDTFNRRDMSRLVRKAETINQDIVISDSSQSEGIEDFRSILDRMEIKKREDSRYTIHYI
jgi:N-acetylglucosamine-6-phosphate deacetylase